MNHFVKSLIKFGTAFGLFLFVQFLFFQLTFQNLIKLDIDENKSILILGDSQLETDLNDSIIEGSINLSNGADISYFSYIKLKKLKEVNPHIETLILGFNYENIYSRLFYDLTVMQSHYGNYFYLMDFEDYQDLIKNNYEVFVRGFVGMVKNYFRVGLIFNDEGIKNLDLGGFNPRPNEYSDLGPSIQKEAKLEYLENASQIELKYFLKIVSFCKKNRIKLIVLSGPMHSSVVDLRKSKKTSFLVMFSEIEGDFDYWNFENFNMDDKLFYDYNHLNHEGANIFSNMINNKLKDSLPVVIN